MKILILVYCLCYNVYADIEDDCREQSYKNYVNVMKIKARLKNITEDQTILQQDVSEIKEDLQVMKGMQEDFQAAVKEMLTNFTKQFSEAQSGLQDQISELKRQQETTCQTCHQQFLVTDECTQGSHDCSPYAFCEDIKVGYKCTCNHGYQGNGTICQDIDECAEEEEDNMCDVNADCVNNDGSFSCFCHDGYTGDGRSCTVIPCETPGKIIDDLGCIIPVNIELTWDDAQINCRDQHGGRLVESSSLSQRHLDLFKQEFYEFLRPVDSYTWIGSRMKWNQDNGGGEGGFPIDPQSPLWYSNQPDRGDQECVFVALPYSRPSLADYGCHESTTSLCQRPMPM